MSADIYGDIKIMNGDIRGHLRRYQNHEHFNGPCTEQTIQSVSFPRDLLNLNKCIDILVHPHQERVVKFDSEVKESGELRVASCE